MSDNWERRILHSYGSQFRLDIQNPQTTVGGADVYNFYSITDDEKTCLVGHQQNGVYRVYNDGTIEIVGGQKKDENGVDIIIAGKNGDVVINADKNGKIRIRGKDVILQADEDIELVAGRNVNIKSGSGRILLKGNTLERSGLKGNILEPPEEWAWRVYEGTGLPAAEFPTLRSAFSGIQSLAGDIIDSPDQFAGFVQGAVSNAISSAGAFT